MKSVPLGRILATPGALETLSNTNTVAALLLDRHHTGDWGDLCEEDCKANEDALDQGGRVMSVYKLADETIWVITEADRSSTTILMSSEY